MNDNRFPPTSRYAATDTAEVVQPDGRRIVYLRRRFVPDPSRYATMLEHRIVEGDRLDRLTAAYLGDAELFWRLADANGVMHPRELEELGRWIRLTLPEGMLGPADA
ncbi:MAG: LysM domain-containing protein [Proteobacteria bacterium]|nr:LysM domain-containing protein [Pseudomonadota bacterium]